MASSSIDIRNLESQLRQLQSALASAQRSQNPADRRREAQSLRGRFNTLRGQTNQFRSAALAIQNPNERDLRMTQYKELNGALFKMDAALRELQAGRQPASAAGPAVRSTPTAAPPQQPRRSLDESEKNLYRRDSKQDAHRADPLHRMPLRDQRGSSPRTPTSTSAPAHAPEVQRWSNGPNERDHRARRSPPQGDHPHHHHHHPQRSTAAVGGAAPVASRESQQAGSPASSRGRATRGGRGRGRGGSSASSPVYPQQQRKSQEQQQQPESRSKPSIAAPFAFADSQPSPVHEAHHQRAPQTAEQMAVHIMEDANVVQDENVLIARRAERTAVETEQRIETVALSLSEQAEKLDEANRELTTIQGQIKRAREEVKWLAKHAAGDRLLIAVCILLALALVGLLFFKIFGNKSSSKGPASGGNSNSLMVNGW